MSVKLLISLCCFVLIQKCLGASTAVEELSDFKSSDFVHDLGRDKPTSQSGNNTIKQLSVAQFPTLANMGISYTLFELQPCGINLPHLHPRATELLYVF